MFYQALRYSALASVALLPCLTTHAQPATKDAQPTLKDAQPTLKEVWTLEKGIDRPESVIFDSERDVLYLSNIGGAPAEKDGNGYLSRVSTDGKMIEQMWVTGGMNAPKGMAIFEDRLYVADIDVLVEIDLPSGEIVKRYPVDEEGDSFLNDVTTDRQGRIYVSCSSLSKIYRLADGRFEVWLDDPDVRNPNGLKVVEGKLIAAAADASAENPGASRYLRKIDLQDRRIEPLVDRTPVGGIDAVEPDGRGGYFLSDWAAGKVFYFSPKGEVALLKQLGRGTADLDYVSEQDRIYLPIMMSDRLVAYQVQR